MDIKTTIEKAIEGGWTLAGLEKDFAFEKRKDLHPLMFLDPLFWNPSARRWGGHWG